MWSACAPPKVTPAYRERLLAAVRRRSRALGLPFSLWTGERLADYLADETGLVHERPERVPLPAGGRHPLEPSPAHDHEPRLRVRAQKKAVEDTRDHLNPGEVFYYADEFNISWCPTLRAMWSPVGQQVMIPTPAHPKRRYGLGAVNWPTGETVVLTRRRKRRKEIAELLAALLEKHPRERDHLISARITYRS